MVSQQSLNLEAPDTADRFKHFLSLATSRMDKQRRDALSYLVGQLTASPPNNPVGTWTLLEKLLPLIADSSRGVRISVLRLFRALPVDEIRPHAEKIIKWVRMGMMNLAAEVRDDSLNVMEWLLETAADEVISCAGGWTKTIDTFAAMLGWKGYAPPVGGKKDAWSSAPKTTFGAIKGGTSYAHQITVLAKFLEVGFTPEKPVSFTYQDYWDHIYRLPKGPNPFAYLGLFGPPQDGEMCPDREARQRAFYPWKQVTVRGTEEAKKEGGAVGRAATILDQALKEGMEDYEHVEEIEW